VSKAHDPHWRYVAIRISGETRLSRRAVSNAILGRARREEIPDDEAPQLTRYEWPHAVVRVHHFRLDAARAWLPSITWAVEAAAKVPITVETLSSSGTIKALTTRLGILTDRGEAPPKTGDRHGGKTGGKPTRPGGPTRALRGAVTPPRRDGPTQQASSVRPPRRD